MNCVFCEIIANESYSENFEHSVVIVPRRPRVPGHIMVVPKIHVDNFIENPSVSAYAAFDAAKVAKRYKSANIITSVGKEATQTVFHLHIHILPRHENDGIVLPWTNQKD